MTGRFVNSIFTTRHGVAHLTLVSHKSLKFTRASADAARVNRSLALTLAAALTALAVALTLGGPAATAQPVASPSLARTGLPADFTMSSFNVLGSKHTSGSGRKKKRFASGPARIRLAAKALDLHGVDVVGFQELQMDQWAEFMAVAGDRYATWPGGVTRRMVQNSVGWRTDTWDFVEGHTIQIPYFEGILWDMPVVLLRHKATGIQAYFANFHNPATNRKRGNNDALRADATTRQISMARSLAYETGLPVFITGDMNERATYFCRLTAEAPMKAANGGSTKNGVCTPPPNPMPVDWIFGTRQRAKFTNYVRDDSKLVNRITDHFMIRTDVRIKPKPEFMVPVVPAPTPTPTPVASPTPTPVASPSPTATATATATASPTSTPTP